MITVKKTERDQRVIDAENVFLGQAERVLREIQCGADVDVVGKPLCITLSNYYALVGYDTGAYQPENYFNVISPDDFTLIYRNVNNN